MPPLNSLPTQTQLRERARKDRPLVPAISPTEEDLIQFLQLAEKKRFHRPRAYFEFIMQRRGKKKQSQKGDVIKVEFEKGFTIPTYGTRVEAAIREMRSRWLIATPPMETVIHYVRTCLARRREALVGILNRQAVFLTTGNMEDLSQNTLKEVSRETGFHETTIRRVLDGVQFTWRGRTIPSDILVPGQHYNTIVVPLLVERLERQAGRTLTYEELARELNRRFPGRFWTPSGELNRWTVSKILEGRFRRNKVSRQKPRQKRKASIT